MQHIVQTRSFEQRLTDFGPELGPFLKKVWDQRRNINVNNFKRGSSQIYRMYSGSADARPYDVDELIKFIRRLRQIGTGQEITIQNKDPHKLSEWKDPQIYLRGGEIWTGFFHVIHKRDKGKSTDARAYVHAADNKSLDVMELIIGQFGKNEGLWEVKTAGPGAKRLDTVVAYFYDTGSRDEIVALLKQAVGNHPDWFVDSLPPLVKREGKGIGSADNPPKLEVVSGKAKYSFGSFYAAIAWLALKTTPNLNMPNKEEPRHMLDNVLHCLRLLQVNPKNPQQFPAKSQLEAWYNSHLKPAANI